MDLIIYDLDGTLRTERQSRFVQPADPSKAVNWRGWQQHMNYCSSRREDVVKLYLADLGRKNCEVVILTSSQFGTREWLHKSQLALPYAVVERQFIDDRPPGVMKLDYMVNICLAGYNVVKWVDNCNEMCTVIEERFPNIEVVRV